MGADKDVAVVVMVRLGGGSHGNHARPKSRSGGNSNKEFAEHDVTPSLSIEDYGDSNATDCGNSAFNCCDN